MPNGEPLPDEIILSRDEAAQVLFALDEGLEAVPSGSAASVRIASAARLIVERFLPDLPDL